MEEKLPRKVGDKLTLTEVVNPIDSSFYRGKFDETLKIEVFIRRFDSLKMEANLAKQEADRDRAALLLTGAHENIIRYFHDQVDNDFYYIVTEWCILSVEDLYKTDDENKVIREKIHQSLTSKDILRQTTQGLVFLHTFDFVHRNIKPSNVLISQDKRKATTKYVVKLSDFRTCKNLQNEPEDSRGKKGSGGWIAPKKTGDISHPSEDVFILGCFFYYVLHPNHRHPFGNSEITRPMNVYEKDHQVYRPDWDHGLTKPKDPKDPDNRQAIALIKEMIKYNPADRPDLKTILDRAYFLPDDYYKLYDVPGVTPGVCVIFNQKNFIKEATRDGSEIDKEALKTIFEDFGFDVKPPEGYNDLKAKQIEDEIKKLASVDYGNYGCLVVCILSHGDEGTICGSDGGEVSIEDLKKKFYGNKSLDGKPKIWIIQACQGDQLQEDFGNYPIVDASKQKIDQDDQQFSKATNVNPGIMANNSHISFPDISRPLISDFLDIRATVPGCVSFRNVETGSTLIRHLCQQLRTAFVGREQPHRHLEDLLKTVQKIISEEIRWIPIKEREENGPRKGTFQPFYNKKHEKVLCKPCKQTIEWRSTLIDFIRFEKLDTTI